MKIKKIIDFLASAKIFHYTCIWLIILVVIGTVAQKTMGLHLAQEKYFSSWFLYAMGIPLPGGRLTMAIMFVNMCFKTFFKSRLSWKKSGIFITHIGVLLLLGGGFITAYFSLEGTMVIPEESSSNFYVDTYKRELALQSKNKTILFAEDKLFDGNKLHTNNTSLQIVIKKHYANIDISTLPQERLAPYRGIATKVDIKSTAVLANGRNLQGLIVEVSGLDNSQNGTYILFDDMLASQYLVIDGVKYAFSLRKRRYPLGFSIKLLDFKQELYPGTSMASSYSSSVLIQDGESNLKQVISMNEPLRYKGFTFYQSSFRQNDNKETTILAVVKNYGRTFPYISSIIICIGLLIHMFIMLPQLILKLQTATSIFVVIFVCSFSSAFANGDLSQVVIQDAGRLKPLDTYAINLLKTLSEKSTYEHKPAIKWLTEVLIHPELSIKQKVFTVRTPAVIKALGISINPKSRYCYADLSNAMAGIMPELRKISAKKHKSLIESQLLDLYAKMQKYNDASSALIGLLPRIRIENQQLAAELSMPFGQKLPYAEFIFKREKVGQLIAELQSSGKQIEDDPALSKLIIDLNAMASAWQPKTFSIIPTTKGAWISPWTALTEHIDDRQMKLFKQFLDIVLKLEAGKNAQAEIDSYIKNVGYTKNIKTEITYNRVNFFYWSLVLYIFGFITVALSWIIWSKPLVKISLISTWFGLVFNFVGLVYRYIIMGRPPVANLYESIIFVAFTSVFMCLLLEYRRRDSIGLMGAAVSGAVVQFVARRYALDGDTMGMLVAVLDSNFWLATHVVTITIGYGATLVASIVGHAYVFKVILKPKEPEMLKSLFANCIGIALVALFFTTLGTILGGIWADQSWGRFWGWDPKENGALLIVLCQVLLIHGRFSGHIKDLGFAIGLGLCSIAVVLAWFGVNLLNIGLHNYGFDNGVARNLYIFCVAEVIVCIFTYYIAKLRLKDIV